MACRILAAEGHESGLAGQVTARADEPGTFWTLEFGYGFDEATPGRMVLVDEDLKPLSGGLPNPGVRFHVWIHRKRPEVQAIVHTHAPYASALSCTSSCLKTLHMDVMAAGGYNEVKPELAEEARDFLLQPSIVRATFAYWARTLSARNAR